MSRAHYRLPPFAALSAFEAAARLGSFKAAAAELNVTPGAISHQIKALEEETGAMLFHRRHRGVDATDTGAALAAALSRSFAEIAAALDRARSTGTGASVTINATTAVSSLWLTPRLTVFWRAHPEIRVNQHVSDEPEPAWLESDLRIVYGAGHQAARAEMSELFRDELVPLAAPALARGAAIETLDDLARMPLIQLRARDRNWTGWRRWFEALGSAAEIRPAMHVNSYMIALQAARDAAGVVLGWRGLVAPLIEAGELVPLGRFQMPAPGAFHVTSGPRERLSPEARTLRDWLADGCPSDEMNSSKALFFPH